jgi:hypothetical protein
MRETVPAGVGIGAAVASFDYSSRGDGLQSEHLNLSQFDIAYFVSI